MFFSKPKVYKYEGEAAALILVDKIKSEGLQSFLANAEVYVKNPYTQTHSAKVE